jgi:hypothetical protein
VKNIIDPNEIDKLYNDNQISLNEAEELRSKWGKLSESEKQDILLPNEKEIQKKILISLIAIKNTNNTIKGWITFFGILQILGILVALVIYNS